MPCLCKAIVPILDYVETAREIVDTVGHTVEHAVHGTKSTLVVEEHQTQNQVLDGGHAEVPNVTSARVGFIDRPQETQDENDPGNLQNRCGDPPLVDPV